MEVVHKMARNLIADLIADFKSLGTLAKATQNDLKTLDDLSINPEELDEGPLASIISPLKKTYRNSHLKLTSDVNGAIEHLKGVSKYCDEIINWLENFREVKEHSKLMELFNNPNNGGATFSNQVGELSRSFDLYVQKVGMSLEGEESLISESAKIERMFTFYKQIIKKLDEIRSIRSKNYKGIKEMFIELGMARLGASIRIGTSVDEKINDLSKINWFLDVAKEQIFRRLNGKFDNDRTETVRNFFMMLVENLRNFDERSSNEYLEDCLLKINGLKTLRYGNFEVDISNPSGNKYNDTSGDSFELLSTTLLYLVLISPENLSLNFKDSSGKEVSKKISELSSNYTPTHNQPSNSGDVPS